MANIDAPRGFKLLKCLDGSLPSIRRYYIPSTDSTAVFTGDLVKHAGGADGQGIGTVAQAAAADAVLGVVMGIDKVAGVADANFNLYQTHRPASVGMYVYVCDDNNALYEVQADDVGSTLAAADIGLNADFIVAAGDTVTGLSGMELDTSTKATTATLPLRIVGLVQRPDNEKFVANQKVIVKLNNHQFGSGTGVAGV